MGAFGMMQQDAALPPLSIDDIAPPSAEEQALFMDYEFPLEDTGPVEESSLGPSESSPGMGAELAERPPEEGYSGSMSPDYTQDSAQNPPGLAGAETVPEQHKEQARQMLLKKAQTRAAASEEFQQKAQQMNKSPGEGEYSLGYGSGY